MDDKLENRYYSFLRDRGYSDVDFLHGVLSVYLPHFAGLDRVLDVGCGHGEFLRILQAAGHEAIGVDIDRGMVQACLDQGLVAHEADVLEWLPAQGEAFDGIFSSNVLEHLAVPKVVALISTCYSALRPGGLLLLAVPNPESLIVQLHEFWRDATHVRLYSLQLLEFFLYDAGFSQVESGENLAARWIPGGAPPDGVVNPFASLSDPARGTSLPASMAEIHVPPLPRPMRRIKMADEYWETLRNDLALFYNWAVDIERWAVDWERRAADWERRTAIVMAPYRASREVFVAGRKPPA